MYTHIYIRTHIYIFVYTYKHTYIHIYIYINTVSRAKMLTDYKSPAQDRIAEREGARLPYFTLPGEHQVCITRKGNPALRLLTNRGQENHLVASSVSARHTRWGKTDNSDTQGLASPWDYILTPAQDATQQRGAATSRRAAGLGAKSVTEICTGTNSSKAQDSDTQANKQPPRGQCRNRPEGLEHGCNAYLHLRRAQPTISACNPRHCDSCYKAMATAPRWADGKPTACAHVPRKACMIPFPWGWTCAGTLGLRA